MNGDIFSNTASSGLYEEAGGLDDEHDEKMEGVHMETGEIHDMNAMPRAQTGANRRAWAAEEAAKAHRSRVARKLGSARRAESRL